MQVLLRTNDMVLISYVEAILTESGIGHVVADQNMSIIEGSLGVIPRRILVEDDSLMQAKRLLRDADLGEHIGEASSTAIG